MNRRDRLQVTRTPDSTLNLGMDETIMLQTSAPRPMGYKGGEPGTEHPEKKGADRKYAVYVAIAIPYVLFLYIAIRRPVDSMMMMSLVEEINLLREENGQMARQIEAMGRAKEVNYAKVEEGARIRLGDGSQLFSYGFLGFRRHKDPSTIFDENIGVGECLALKGQSGRFTVDLGKEVEISKVGLYHPATKDTSSAVHEFEVFGSGPDGRVSAGVFEYDTGACGFQTFEIGRRVVDSVEFVVRSNGGNKRFTCVYKVYLLGNK